MNARRILAAVVFLAAVVAANALTAAYGLIPVGFGLMATAGTWAAGLVFVARDLVHDTAGRRAVLALVAVGAALSAWLAGPQLALASGLAFAVSEATDMAVYTPLRRRGWVRAALASNVVGGLVDTVLFLAVAGFPIWSALPGQMLAKTAVSAAVVSAVAVARAVLRDRVRPQGS